MADEHKTEEGTETPKPEKVFSQSELDAIIRDRLKREGEKIADYSKVKEELETLRAKEIEREAAEMSEADKLKKQVEELNKSLKDVMIQKDEAVQFRQTWEEQETKKIETAMDGLTDSQKTLVSELPLTRRMDAINEFKVAKAAPGSWAQMGKQTKTGTLKDLSNLREELGPNHPDYIRAVREHYNNK